MSVPKSIMSGKITLFGVELECHVLDNGQRIIERESLLRLMEAMGKGGPVSQDEMMDYVAFMRNGKLPDAPERSKADE